MNPLVLLMGLLVLAFVALVVIALIVDLLADLGVSSDASRTALSRLVKQGLIERSRSGRATSRRTGIGIPWATRFSAHPSRRHGRGIRSSR